MPQYDIVLAYDQQRGALAFEDKEPINQLLIEKAINRMSPLANMYSVFGYMNIQNNGKFKVTGLSQLPLGLRSCTPCSWDPISHRVKRSLEIEPCCLEADEEFCPQEELNAIFTGIIDLVANPNGTVDVAKRTELTNALVTLWEDGISQAYNGILAEGQVYSGTSIAWSAAVTASAEATAIQTNFPKTANACRGYAKLLSDMSATYSWLKLKSGALATGETGIYVTTINGVGGANTTVNQDKYTGNPVTAVQFLKANAQAELLQVVNQGVYVTGSGETRMPFIICDVAFYDRVVQYYNETVAPSALVIESPLTKQKVMADFKGKNGQVFKREIDSYFIYGLPVIVDPNLNTFDYFKKAHLHFVALTISNNIQLGTSLGRSAIDAAMPPVTFQASPLIKDKGKVYMTTSMFAATALASEKHIVSSQLLVSWT